MDTKRLLLLGLCISSVHTRNSCGLINTTTSAEKDNCPFCVVLTTTACSGYCLTKDAVYKGSLLAVYQHVCTYKEIRYETIKLPGCPQGVDPTYTYPVAVSCECNLCRADYTDCTLQSIDTDFCTTERLQL